MYRGVCETEIERSSASSASGECYRFETGVAQSFFHWLVAAALYHYYSNMIELMLLS